MADDPIAIAALVAALAEAVAELEALQTEADPVLKQLADKRVAVDSLQNNIDLAISRLRGRLGMPGTRWSCSPQQAAITTPRGMYADALVGTAQKSLENLIPGNIEKYMKRSAQ